MKVLTCSRHFPKWHPKEGEPTFFIESIFNSLGIGLDNIADPIKEPINDFALMAEVRPKHHTIRTGNRWKVGDMASLRVWSDKPYRSKQIEFAQAEVKKVWAIEIYQGADVWEFKLNGKALNWVDFNIDEFVDELAKNDGLSTPDFLHWFAIHPKAKGRTFTGQIICWSDAVNY